MDLMLQFWQWILFKLEVERRLIILTLTQLSLGSKRADLHQLFSLTALLKNTVIWRGSKTPPHLTSGPTDGAFLNFPLSNHQIPQSTMKETREE